jgi:hypothetical protein
MIWNAWVLGLIIGQIAIAAINAAAFFNAIKIVRRWDTASLAPVQLELEHRSELIATIVSWSLLFQIFSLLVFEITARSLAPFIPGAMCTVGSLQAHNLGWPILFLKMGALYLYGWWIVINHVDLQLEGFLLTRLKSWYMIVLFPLLAADLIMQIIYFTGLDPSVISSCCGVIFEVQGEGFGSSVASLPPKLTRTLLLYSLAILIVLSYAMRWENKAAGKLAYALGSGIELVLGIAGIVAFVAPYVYMMPALHCPFIFLDQEHFNYGYLVYIPLFAASFLGVSLAVLAAVEWKFPAARLATRPLGAIFLKYSRVFWVVFLITAYAPVFKFWIDTGGGSDLFQGVY